MADEQTLAISVAELDFTVRTKNCLLSEGILTVGSILQHTQADLLKTPNLGRKSINEIKEVLMSMGLQWESGAHICDTPHLPADQRIARTIQLNCIPSPSAKSSLVAANAIQALFQDSLSLRDHFAALAMQALINPMGEPLDRLSDVPQYAYEIADAMLLAREGGGNAN